MKKFVCMEDGEVFITSADTMEEAQNNAAMYGGQCVRELSQKEYADFEGTGEYKIKL